VNSEQISVKLVQKSLNCHFKKKRFFLDNGKAKAYIKKYRFVPHKARKNDEKVRFSEENMQILKVKPQIVLRRMFARLVRAIYRIQNISLKQ